MTWVALVGIAWAVAAVALGLLLGRGIALADRVERPAEWTGDVEQFLRDSAARGAASGPLPR